ncbi:transcription termination/antitermination NusG family protein [Treponema peruense]|uniref:KOW domain-containing protein n=1 Tax=Treponema peruense TaxID=2787628 RepID=A0A7T3RFF4_9SPIR|nr:transcription termination/antitermination NusG family protein [Treponema peruense]QQA02152.1 hypothetical protein IWA51_06125 [Treponema peruense]
MEFYCLMVLTGQEESFKKEAADKLSEEFAGAKFYFFKRKLRTNQGKYFDQPLFPGYLFFEVEELSEKFFDIIKRVKGFVKVLLKNDQPTKICGVSLEELKTYIRNGETWGISKVLFLPGQNIRVISGPLKGLEGNIYKINKKKKHITVISSLSPDGKKFDLLYEDAVVVE